jgi:transposase
MRALTRARADALRALQDAQGRLTAFVLRHARRAPGRAHGGPAPCRWRSAGVCPTPAQHLGCQAYGRAVRAHHARRQRLDQERKEHVRAWRFSPGVAALQALRGVPWTVAVPLRTAMGDRPRFARPRARMQCLGLMPSEPASGAPRRAGSMTTAGTTQARRVLGAGAWADRSPAKGSHHLPRRRETPPTGLQDIRGQAQVRRCQRARRLGARGPQAPVVTGAIAREGSGFLWAMAQEVSLVAENAGGC